MEAAILKAKQAGKGVFGMKPLGGGNLLASKEACFDYILGLETLDAIAFGMQSVDEVRYNVARINGEPIEAELENGWQARRKACISVTGARVAANALPIAARTHSQLLMEKHRWTIQSV